MNFRLCGHLGNNDYIDLSLKDNLEVTDLFSTLELVLKLSNRELVLKSFDPLKAGVIRVRINAVVLQEISAQETFLYKKSAAPAEWTSSRVKTPHNRASHFTK